MKLRLRHPSGDLPLFELNDPSMTIAQVKEMVFSQWPTEGPLSKENPSAASDLRLLCAGKFLEDARTLKDYRKEMGTTGDPPGGAGAEGQQQQQQQVVTMHVLVRPPQAGRGAGGAAKEQGDGDKADEGGCCGGCVIS